MKKLVVTKDPKTVSERAVLKQAREAFIQMQKSWWNFAKLIYTIREGETYKAIGYETFMDYCEKEYPEINMATIRKYCIVVDTWGPSIESKIAKDAMYSLPAYESCYAVIAVKDGVLPKEEVDALKRDVLEKKLSYHRLREKMKELLESKRKEIYKSSTDIKRHEEQLLEEIERDVSDEEEDDSSIDGDYDTPAFMDDTDDEDMKEFEYEDDEELAIESETDAIVAKSHKYTRDLYQTLDVLQDRMTELRSSSKVVNFAFDLEKLCVTSDSILTKIQEIRE